VSMAASSSSAPEKRRISSIDDTSLPTAADDAVDAGEVLHEPGSTPAEDPRHVLGLSNPTSRANRRGFSRLAHHG
jgi:hypothetical protein